MFRKTQIKLHTHPFRPMPEVPKTPLPWKRYALNTVLGAFCLGSTVVAINACSGSQTNVGVTAGVTPSPGGVQWTVGVNIGINIAKQALPIVEGLVDNQPGIPAQVKGQIHQGVQTAVDSLSLAQTAFTAFTNTHDVASMCLAHAEIETAVTGALQAMTVIRDAGVNIPMGDVMAANAALGGLAVVADQLYPSCIAHPGAAHISAQARVNTALRGR